MVSLEEAFTLASAKFQIPSLNEHQKVAIKEVVTQKKDVFVNLPTGFGKSLIYEALPLMFKYAAKLPGHIVIVVSPLVSPMENQVKYLRSIGVSAVNISSQTDNDHSRIENGQYSVVFGSPEAWLMNDRWRTMLGNVVYKSKLCAVAIDEAHVIKQWGTSQDGKLAAFRECYAHLHELRSLAPEVPIIALTATATKLTKDTFLNVLLMDNPYEIKESPNKLNLTYVVECMRKDTHLEFYFEWLIDELKTKQVSCEKTIIYCQTIKQCGIVYGTIKGLLGHNIYAGIKESVLVEMLHSCTPAANKQNILHSFQIENGTIRLLIATIAFGMGVDCKGVHRIVHFGPSKTVEAYVQETGRAGRDGVQSMAYTLYHGILLSHVEGQMKTSEFRRLALLKHFDSVLQQPEKNHLCCDNCAAGCKCGMEDCGTYAKYPSHQSEITPLNPVREREIPPQKQMMVEQNLTKYHKSLVRQLVNTTAYGDLKTLTNIHFMLGFSDHQISQVVENLGVLFSLSDIYNYVEICDKRHALKILSIISDMFGDVNEDNQSCYLLSDDDDDNIFDDELQDEQNEILQDEELFDMIVDNLSFSQLQSSLFDEGHISDGSYEADVPSAAVETIETMNFDDE
ncbi:uncharacterized protein [Montipora capricornis]|uniref:uncharacterized protein n=1 Tax=Montipora capricornis TaxID=246305 RepID=UPI0035F11118